VKQNEERKRFAEALTAQNLCYAQGFPIVRAAQKRIRLAFNFRDIANLARGCIHSSIFRLKTLLMHVDENHEALKTYLLSDYFAGRNGKQSRAGLRKAVVLAAQS